MFVQFRCAQTVQNLFCNSMFHFSSSLFFKHFYIFKYFCCFRVLKGFYEASCDSIVHLHQQKYIFTFSLKTRPKFHRMYYEQNVFLEHFLMFFTNLFIVSERILEFNDIFFVSILCKVFAFYPCFLKTHFPALKKPFKSEENHGKYEFF